MPEPTYKVRDFQPADAPAFAALNRRWIEEYFGMEEVDERVLSDPETAILAPGGFIAVAHREGRVIGTGALMVPHEQAYAGAWFELVKMATDPSAQGQGVGAAIIRYLANKARGEGARAIWLETNDKLAAATRLYQREGFKVLGPYEERPTPYSCCNLQMALTL